ncbi:MAG: hypothetical protein MSS61_00450 [Bacteroidales bacterium]|nr:hypothetical protein [Bacteroidales bacterium]
MRHVSFSEKVSAHRPMGYRPPTHGRSPTVPWALAHRPVGARPSPRGR